MFYLFLEMGAWLLLAFGVGLLLGAWIAYTFCNSAKKTEPSAKESLGDSNTELPGSSTQLASNVIDESGDVVPAKLANLNSDPVIDRDDLQILKGVGPKLEKLLNELGIYNFQQIADWQQKDIDWVNDKLSFSGRIEREEWVSQAKSLATGTGTT